MQSESEERLRAILDTAVDAIITIDRRGIIESANQATSAMFGYSINELVGNNINMLMPAPYSQEHNGYLANYERTGQKKIIGIGREVTGRRKDGSTFPMELAVSEMKLAGERCYTGIVRDLTERVNAEEIEASLGRILEESLNEIYIFDAQTLKFVQVNRGARDNLGYTLEELREMTPLDLKPTQTPESFAELIEPLRSAAVPVIHFETLHARKDGSRYDVEVHMQRAKYRNQSVYVAIILDTSERRLAEEKLLRQQAELQELNEELEDRVRLRTSELETALEDLVRQEKLATLGQLAGSVAHEIRNPLGVIKNAVYYLESSRQNLDQDSQDAFAEVNRALATSNRIVSELLDYAREPKLEAVRTPASSAIERALSQIDIPSNIEVQREAEASDLNIVADQGHVERILVNLIQNAVQAMPHGGELTLRCVPHPNSLEIQVQDTGQGIAASELERIFEPLFSKKVKGVGLGLALSRRYAELNGGRLVADSPADSGATFRLWLPNSSAVERG